MQMDGFAVFYRPLENTYKIAVIIIIKTFKIAMYSNLMYTSEQTLVVVQRPQMYN